VGVSPRTAGDENSLSPRGAAAKKKKGQALYNARIRASALPSVLFCYLRLVFVAQMARPGHGWKAHYLRPTAKLMEQVDRRFHQRNKTQDYPARTNPNFT